MTKNKPIKLPLMGTYGTIGVGTFAQTNKRYCKLLELPDGQTSSQYELTVGSKYLIEGYDGSNIRIRTHEGIASIHIGRVEIL